MFDILYFFFQHILVLPLPSRLHGTLETPYLPVFISFFEFIICLCSNLDDTENISKCVTNIENQLNSLTEFLKESTLKRSNDFLDKRKTMEVVVNCVEVGICFHDTYNFLLDISIFISVNAYSNRYCPRIFGKILVFAGSPSFSLFRTWSQVFKLNFSSHQRQPFALSSKKKNYIESGMCSKIIQILIFLPYEKM